MSSVDIQESSIKLNQTNLTTTNSSTLSCPTDTLVAQIETYAVPVICIGGIIGNTVSAFVFLQKSLRGHSSSLFLAARSISDNGFLATLLMIWASSVFDLHLGEFPFICQLLIFFTYVFGCYSVWLVVFLTAENYIRICRPFLAQRLCKTRNAKILMLILLLSNLVTYNFPFWTMGESCIPLRKYYTFIQILVYLDSGLTIVIPAIFMTILMSAILFNTITSYKRRTSSNTRARNPLMTVTAMLLAVTLHFVLLNLPHHVVRFMLLMMAYAEKGANISLINNNCSALAMQSISQLLYYVSLSTNVLIYAVVSSKFRNTLNACLGGKNTRRYARSGDCNEIYPVRKVNNPFSKISGNRNKFKESEETFPLRCFKRQIL